MVAQVKIACKLPNGLTVRHKDQTRVLNGANHPQAVAGFGVTPGIDEDWFKDWQTTDGKDLPFVKNGSVFIMKDAAAARERKDVVTGMEPLDPDKPAPGIEPTDETKKVLSGEDV